MTSSALDITLWKRHIVTENKLENIGASMEASPRKYLCWLAV
jgi:hypothetical protein